MPQVCYALNHKIARVKKLTWECNWPESCPLPRRRTTSWARAAESPPPSPQIYAPSSTLRNLTKGQKMSLNPHDQNVRVTSPRTEVLRAHNQYNCPKLSLYNYHSAEVFRAWELSCDMILIIGPSPH